MSNELKNSPIEDFDWEAYENGETKGDKTREELTQTYDESLNTVRDKDVIEVPSSRSTNAKQWLTSATRATASYP